MLLVKLIIGLTLILFGGGLLFLYLKMKELFNILNVLLIAGISVFSAISISSVIGFLDYVFNNSRFIGIDQTALLILAFWGAFISLIMTIYIFIVSFKKNGLMQRIQDNINSKDDT